jgi:hypothetical protein
MRERLPERRPADTISFISECLGGKEVAFTAGRFPDGRLGELFVHNLPTGSNIAAISKEWATAVSIGLQCGATLDEFHANVQREPSGKACTVLGEILDKLAEDRP